MEPVKRGGTIIGVTCSDGVVIGAEEPDKGQFTESNASRKILKVDDHVGMAVAGLESDARVLVDQARRYAQNYWLTYDEPIDVEALVKRVADLKQTHTQYARMRPFGVSLLFGGVDKIGSRLFATDPAGTYKEYKAHAEGAGADTAMKFLKKKYNENIEMKETVRLTVECLLEAIKARGVSPRIGVATIPKETKKFRFLTEEEIRRHK
jgi:proteasome alpha subunit